MLAPTPRTVLSLDGAVVWDCETLPNLFSMNVVALEGDLDITFQISEFVDDRDRLFEWIDHWKFHNTIMIGFNSIGFDYPVLHRILTDRKISIGEIYHYAMSIIDSESRWGSVVWESERFCPQLDIYKVHHFDNRNKSTSLKALQFNMRSETVLEMPLPWGVPVTWEQTQQIVLPYNRHDVRETKKFALISKDAITLRLDLLNSGDLRGDVLNFSDTKIGGKLLETRLGRDVCYHEDGSPKQTFRTSIPLGEIVLPFVSFRQPAFQKVLERIRATTLTADQIDIENDNATKIKTKGVFSDLTATLPCGAPDSSNFNFDFGVGGIHGSVSEKRFDVRGTDWRLIDIDVTGLYPSIAIVNRFYPAHLGERFVEEYEKLPIERKQFKKGTSKNLAFKLAANGTYGNSNNQYSVFYDPRFTMAITVNGQLMLCMLVEWLLMVHTLQIVQVNTDGCTYLVHKDFAKHAEIQRAIWERVTRLELEEAEYGRMWIKNVNNYCAEDLKGKLKLKGDAFWYPQVFPDDISNASAWHKNLSAMVIPRAAIANMVTGVDVGEFVRCHRDPFDFMLRAKVDRASKLMLGDVEQQRITRYYVAHDGAELKKVSPPKGEPGAFKRKNGISDYEWHTISQSVAPGQWDARVHTKNKSKYETRVTSIEKSAGVCNRAVDFSWDRLNFEWYASQAEKLVIA